MRPPLWHPPIELSLAEHAIIKRIRRAKHTIQRRYAPRVATFPWIGWQKSSGLGGNIPMDWVAIFPWTGWQKSVEYATLYRKGAAEITARLAEKDRKIATLESQLAAVSQSQVFPALPATEPVPALTWTPPRQLALIAAEDMPTYRITSPRCRPARSKRRP